MILVDSNVWIAAWKGGHPEVQRQLGLLIEAGETTINELIRTELLQGARDREHQKKLSTLLEPIPVAHLSPEIWQAAPPYFLDCREKGITLTTIDCLIAVHALERKVRLWSLDQIFERLPRLRLFSI